MVQVVQAGNQAALCENHETDAISLLPNSFYCGLAVSEFFHEQMYLD